MGEAFFSMDFSDDKEEFKEVLKELLESSVFEQLSETEIQFLAEKTSQDLDCSSIIENIHSGIELFATMYVNQLSVIQK